MFFSDRAVAEAFGRCISGRVKPSASLTRARKCIPNDPDFGGSQLERIMILLNDGAGQFSEPTEFELSQQDWGVSIFAADLNSDGRLDMVATNEELASDFLHVAGGMP